jgi:hypothetical protein
MVLLPAHSRSPVGALAPCAREGLPGEGVGGSGGLAAAPPLRGVGASMNATRGDLRWDGQSV